MFLEMNPVPDNTPVTDAQIDEFLCSYKGICRYLFAMAEHIHNVADLNRAYNVFETPVDCEPDMREAEMYRRIDEFIGYRIPRKNEREAIDRQLEQQAPARAAHAARIALH